MNRRSSFRMLISVAAVEVGFKEEAPAVSTASSQTGCGWTDDGSQSRQGWMGVHYSHHHSPPTPLFPLCLFLLLLLLLFLLPQTALWRLTDGARRGGAGLSIFISDLNKSMNLSSLKAFQYRAAFYQFFLGGQCLRWKIRADGGRTWSAALESADICIPLKIKRVALVIKEAMCLIFDFLFAAVFVYSLTFCCSRAASSVTAEWTLFVILMQAPQADSVERRRRRGRGSVSRKKLQWFHTSNHNIPKLHPIELENRFLESWIVRSDILRFSYKSRGK